MRGQVLKRLALAAVLAVGGAVVLQAPANCNTLAATTVVSAIDFCSVIDCQGGLFGGLIRPCGSPTSTADDLLADCQNFADAEGNP